MANLDTYKAFICYSHKDAAYARRLHRRLENYRPPGYPAGKWPLRPIFIDRSELSSSPDLSESIQKALVASESLIVICSPGAALSRWVNEEILYFKRLGKTSIHPLVLCGDPASTEVGKGCFPEALRYRLGKDGELSKIPAEPLAADARKGQDGRDAELKLVAGLLSIPFDKLKVRQQRRRVRQALLVAGGAVTMLFLTSFLAISAVIARQDAERRRDQAENLIAFMVGDLRERLQPAGRLDVLDGVGEQVLAYFSGLRDSELTDETLLTRATALRQIGEVRVAQGSISEALLAFNQALSILENSTTQNEAVRLFELGQINYWIADAYFNDLQLEEARFYIENYLNISRQLVQIEPANPDYQLELLYAESNLGTLAFRSNQLVEARQYFNNALDAGRLLAASLPGEASDYELADTVSWLGAVEINAGNLQAATEWYSELLEIRRGLVVANPTPGNRHQLARALGLMADLHYEMGQQQRALESRTESLQVFRELLAYDPLNSDWRAELGWAGMALTRDNYAQGEFTAEQGRATIALARESMHESGDETSAETVRVTASLDFELAAIELAEGFYEDATELAQRAVQQLSPYLNGSDRVRILPLYARAAYILTEVELAKGNLAAARSLAENAMAEIDVSSTDANSVKANAASLAFYAGSPAAELLKSEVAASEYKAQAYLPGTRAADWWQTAMSD